MTRRAKAAAQSQGRPSRRVVAPAAPKASARPTTRIGGVEIAIAKPKAPLAGDKAAKIRAAVRSVYGAPAKP